MKINTTAFLSTSCLSIRPTWEHEGTWTTWSRTGLKTALCLFGSHISNVIAEVWLIKHKRSKAPCLSSRFCVCFRTLRCSEVLRVEKAVLGHRGRAAPPARASAWITGWRWTSRIHIHSTTSFSPPKHLPLLYFRRKWQNPVGTNMAAGPTPGPRGSSLPMLLFWGSCCWIKITATSHQVKR